MVLIDYEVSKPDWHDNSGFGVPLLPSWLVSSGTEVSGSRNIVQEATKIRGGGE